MYNDSVSEVWQNWLGLKTGKCTRTGQSTRNLFFVLTYFVPSEMPFTILSFMAFRSAPHMSKKTGIFFGAKITSVTHSAFAGGSHPELMSPASTDVPTGAIL